MIILPATPGGAAGPTGWGGGACHEITAFPVVIMGPGVYCLSFKYSAIKASTPAVYLLNFLGARPSVNYLV